MNTAFVTCAWSQYITICLIGLLQNLACFIRILCRSANSGWTFISGLTEHFRNFSINIYEILWLRNLWTTKCATKCRFCRPAVPNSADANMCVTILSGLLRDFWVFLGKGKPIYIKKILFACNIPKFKVFVKRIFWKKGNSIILFPTNTLLSTQTHKFYKEQQLFPLIKNELISDWYFLYFLAGLPALELIKKAKIRK